jgi:isopenicillin-N epimerase
MDVPEAGRPPDGRGASEDGRGASELVDRGRGDWRLDPEVAYLNHGSFGACPEPVLEAQRRWRDRMEREPVRFLDRELEGLLDEARTQLGAFLRADPAGLAFVPNATTGVAAVLASLRFAPGDELIATDHEYNATLNALARVAERDGARVVIARIPFPLDDPDRALEAVRAAAGPRTRLLLVSHVTSPTALVLPIERLVPWFEGRGIPVLVDGAHAPGMLELDLDRLGASYYTGNAHKWMCAPKGAAFLHAREDRRAAVRPLATSHGANDPRTDRERFRLEWDWTGTADPSPYLSIPEAIRCVGSMLPGGWPELMADNRRRALAARDRLAGALGLRRPAPDGMLGAMAALPLPLGGREAERASAVQATLIADRVEAPIMPWPVRAAQRGGRPDVWLVRVSVQRYTVEDDVERLVASLRRGLARR